VSQVGWRSSSPSPDVATSPWTGVKTQTAAAIERSLELVVPRTCTTGASVRAAGHLARSDVSRDWGRSYDDDAGTAMPWLTHFTDPAPDRDHTRIRMPSQARIRRDIALLARQGDPTGPAPKCSAVVPDRVTLTPGLSRGSCASVGRGRRRSAPQSRR